LYCTSFTFKALINSVIRL